MTQTSHDTFAAFVGLDWADAQHDGCLQGAGSAQREYFQLAHTPEAIDAWVTTLRTRFDGQPVALCLELTKGPLVSALRKYDFLVLFPINPLTLARYREAFTPSPSNVHPVLDFLGHYFRRRDVVTIFVCRPLRWFLLGTARLLLVTS